MAANATLSVPSTTSNPMSSADSGSANGASHDERAQGDLDDGSSSLSDLGDRAGHEEMDRASIEGSDAIDTEAETERLDDSPPKQRKHPNVILTSANVTYAEPPSPPVDHALSKKIEDFSQFSPSNRILEVANDLLEPDSEGDRPLQTSDISSLEDSSEENGNAVPITPSSPRKRKRSSIEDDSLIRQELLEGPSSKAAKTFGSPSTGYPATLDDRISHPVQVEEVDQEDIDDTVVFPNNDLESKKAQQSTIPKQKYKKGRRKGKKPIGEELMAVDIRGSGAGSPGGLGEDIEAMYSNGEDAEMEDLGEGPEETENPMKNEEGFIQKKIAMDSLNAIEKCFATLRDKLFNERLAQYNEELALLEQPIPAHRELLAMKEAIDQRRDQKIEYENTLLKYKLKTLERESIANKSQAHSQYVQTVREVRDSHLDRLNKEYYQIQRERRSCEGDVPDYMYKFTTKRSQQITQQTAYNMEVSILSGVAKHVGFPAAPRISQARPKEIDYDLRNMEISAQALHPSQNHPPVLRASVSAPAVFPRQKSGAEEDFIEQNPWANAQHPMHHQQRQQVHRQAPVESRAATPSSTPAAQRRVIDLNQTQGSASTIAEPQSGQNSSVAPTPATGEAGKFAHSGKYPPLIGKMVDSTPSRITGAPIEAIPANLTLLEATTDKGKAPQRSKSDQSHSPTLPRNPSQETQVPSALPKPLAFVSSAPGARASTPPRYPLIKAEDVGHVPRHSPISQQYHPAANFSTVLNGQMNRFTA